MSNNEKVNDGLCTIIKEYQENKTTNSSGNFTIKELENKNGFIVYSKEKINETTIQNGKKTLFDEFKKDYEDCKNYEEINGNEETYTHRYYYYEKILDEGETITIIMLNPAFAYSKKADPTIENIKDFIKKHNNDEQNEKIGAFEIINLYSIRMPKSAKLKSMLEKLGIKEDENLNNNLNTKFIKEYIKKTKNKILVAWGVSYHKEATKLFEDNKNNIKKKLYSYALTEKTNLPRHFSSCSYNQAKNKKLMKFSFEYVHN